MFSTNKIYCWKFKPKLPKIKSLKLFFCWFSCWQLACSLKSCYFKLRFVFFFNIWIESYSLLHINSHNPIEHINNVLYIETIKDWGARSEKPSVRVVTEPNTGSLLGWTGQALPFRQCRAELSANWIIC